MSDPLRTYGLDEAARLLHVHSETLRQRVRAVLSAYPARNPGEWWAVQGSNLRPCRVKASAVAREGSVHAVLR